VDFLPWSIFSIPALIAKANYRRPWTEPRIQFCLLWFLSVFVFFTISDTKRDLYLLPVMPVLALFVANYLDDLATRLIGPSMIFTLLTTIFFGIVAVSGLALPITAWIGWPDAFWPILPVSLVLAAGGALTVALILRGRLCAAGASVSGMMLLTTVAAALWLFPYLERFKSQRRFALEVSRMVPGSAPLYVYADGTHDFNFYTQREEIPVLISPTQIESLRARPEKSYLLIRGRDLKKDLGSDA
jgi:4-amino-4-deoxy-L-arabinose transferase-like glycosyltransferase